jgi:nucleoredoxin
MLAEIYTVLREEEKDLTKSDDHVLEIIFVSSDRDRASFEEYFKSMPWAALPFDEHSAKAELAQKFSVSGIPALFIVNTADGRVVDSDARSTVMNARGNARSLLRSWNIL